MSSSNTSLSEINRSAAEGLPDWDGRKDADNPLQTMLIPVLKTGSEVPPSAETGMVTAVIAQAEGRDTTDNQDASRTTAETLASPLPHKSAVSQRTPLVLIIEDTTELAEVIQATLERMNMIASYETHGAKALESFEKMHPDVVLLDIGLPDMTGWKFLETIKDKHKDSMPIIIIITAYGDPANRLVGKLQGVNDYLIKPFTAAEVEQVVARALQGPVV
jgi:CheY-like chemotaxis protein